LCFCSAAVAGAIPVGAGSTFLGAAGVQIVSMEDNMKPSSVDEVAGKVHELKGKIKEKFGHLTNNSDLEAEGTVEKIGGKIQHKIGQVEKVIEKT
jgi:uncharacterized protein YjbJ (UPF0337 family)